MPDIDTVMWSTIFFGAAAFLLSCLVLFLIIFLAVRAALGSHARRMEDQQLEARIASRQRV